jgi:hypothetical protein
MRYLVPNHKREIANRQLISSEKLEKNFNAGLGHFIALLNSVSDRKKSELIDSLDRVSDEIVAAR